MVGPDAVVNGMPLQRGVSEGEIGTDIFSGTDAHEKSTEAERFSVTHLLASRRDVLDPVIDLAISTAIDASDRLAVWNVLTQLANSDGRPPPLMGFDESEVKYMDGETTKLLSKKSFMQRWLRRTHRAAIRGPRKTA